MDLRGGPAQARRVCSEASSVARVGSPLSTGRARGHDSAPAVVVPAFLSPRCAPARGWQMRGSARAAKGGSRDVPPPTPHCARTAGRATHAARAQTGTSAARGCLGYRAARARNGGWSARGARAQGRASGRQRASLHRAHERTKDPPLPSLLLRARSSLARSRGVCFGLEVRRVGTGRRSRRARSRGRRASDARREPGTPPRPSVFYTRPAGGHHEGASIPASSMSSRDEHKHPGRSSAPPPPAGKAVHRDREYHGGHGLPPSGKRHFRHTPSGTHAVATSRRLLLRPPQ